MSFFAVKTTASQEETVAQMIAESGFDKIKACLAPEKMTAYVIVEAEDAGIIERAIEEVPHAQKIVEGQSSFAEVAQFLEPASDVDNISEGDVVEITGGGFRGEKAKVQDIDEANEEVTVELFDATVPIPVTLGGHNIKVLDSEKQISAE